MKFVGTMDAHRENFEFQVNASYTINTEIFKLNMGESHGRCILMYELYECMYLLMEHMKNSAFIWKLSRWFTV